MNSPAERAAAAGIWCPAPAHASDARWRVLLGIVAIAHGIATCVLPLTQVEAPIAYLTAYWDDFFYYLQIARNLVTEFRSTFDGVDPTNGYHPLWMLVLTALCALFDPAQMAFHAALASLIGALGVLTAFAIFAYARAGFAVSPPVAVVLALIGQTFYATLGRHGMEIALAVPLLFAFALAGRRFVEHPQFGTMALWSGLGALTILARLDAAIAVALVGLVLVLRTPWSQSRHWLTPQIGAAALAGAAPLLAYVVVNTAVFGTVMPISGQAKQLAPFPVLSGNLLNHLVYEPLHAALRGRISLYLTHGILPAIIALLALAQFARRRPVDTYWAAVHLALLVFPFALMAAQFLLSDWILWPWYFYMFVPAMASALASFLIGAPQEAPHRLSIGVALTVTALAGAMLTSASMPRPRESRPEYGMAEASLAVAAFAARHEGRLAMGDRAGRVGFLVPNRVVQLEGLVGAPDLLETIRSRADLIDTLRARGVRYYVGTRMATEDDCMIGNEPKVMQAGTKSPRMTGRFCAAPVFRHVDDEGVVTLIFDVEAEPAKR